MTANNRLTANRSVRKMIGDYLRCVQVGEKFLLEDLATALMQDNGKLDLDTRRVGAIIREFQYYQTDDAGGVLPVVRRLAPCVWQRIPCGEVAE